MEKKLSDSIHIDHTHRIVFPADRKNNFEFIHAPSQGTLIHPRYLMIHSTEGPDFIGAVETLTKKKGASAHLVIGRDGEIVQLVPFNHEAFHTMIARNGFWDGYKYFNKISIGIELENAGRMHREGNSWKAHGKIYPSSEVEVLTHQYDSEPAGWHKFTPIQIELATKIGQLLAKKYDLVDILGHEDYLPEYKWDPGPAFPMQEYKAKVLGKRLKEPVVYRPVGYLQLLTQPQKDADPTISEKLPPTTHYRMLERRRGWLKVAIEAPSSEFHAVEGWISDRLLIRQGILPEHEES